MTDWSADFLPRDGQLFPRTIGETLASLTRSRWPRDTAKAVAKAWGLDLNTARNLTKGHASERTITKALKAEGWDLLECLGQALTGQTHHEWEVQKLQRIIDEAESAKENIQRLRADRARHDELVARSLTLDAALDGTADRRHRSGDIRGRRKAG